MSGSTWCAAYNNGRTLEELMRSLGSMSGTTGDLMGGDTLAGGRSSEPGDSLRFTETAAGHGQKMYPAQQKVRRMRTDFFHKDDVIILVFVIARCISLAPLPRECLSGRASRHSADGCMHYVSACKTNQGMLMVCIPSIPAC